MKDTRGARVRRGRAWTRKERKNTSCGVDTGSARVRVSGRCPKQRRLLLSLDEELKRRVGISGEIGVEHVRLVFSAILGRGRGLCGLNCSFFVRTHPLARAPRR